MALRFSRPAPKYACLPKEKRAGLVSRQGFLSTVPAERINDTILCANGSIKGLVYGDPINERITFNHEKLYMPSWKTPPEPPKIADVLPDIRRMLKEGRFKETPYAAQAAILRDETYNTLMKPGSDGKTRMSIHANMRHCAYTLCIDTKTSGDIYDYIRSCDYETGEVCVRFKDAANSFVRRMCASRTDRAAYISLEAVNKFDTVISLADLGGQPRVSWTGDAYVKCILTGAEREFCFNVIGRYPPEYRDSGFAACVLVRLCGGKGSIEGDRLNIADASSVLISTAIERIAPFDADYADVLGKRFANITEAYPALLSRSAEAVRPLMTRSSLKLGDETLDSIEEILDKTIADPRKLPNALYEKLYAAGRSFLIGDTGELPPGYGQYNINVNLQVCSGNITSLPEQMLVFFKLFESKFDDFRLNAKNIFGCRGIMAGIHPNEESGLMYHFSAPWPHFYWVACAGWVYNEFWGHWLTTGDTEFLREHIVPGLKEVVLFFEDYLKDTDAEGNYIFYPCFSPENGQAHGYPITINALMDIFVCREALTNLLEACRVLDIKDEKENKWREMLSKLPTLLLDNEGALREWAWQTIPDDLDHRHVSHHYAVWPGFDIRTDTEPELSEAVLKSNHKRGQENDSAHGLMHRLFTAIRLKDVYGAEVYLHQLAEHGFVNSGLMTNHNPHRTYFPDALGGLPAALAEMCVYSRPGVIELLPTMSRDFAKGEITGVSLYTFARLDKLNWDMDAHCLNARITSLKDQTIEIRVGSKTRTVSFKAGESINISEEI